MSGGRGRRRRLRRLRGALAGALLVGAGITAASVLPRRPTHRR